VNKLLQREGGAHSSTKHTYMYLQTSCQIIQLTAAAILA